MWLHNEIAPQHEPVELLHNLRVVGGIGDPNLFIGEAYFQLNALADTQAKLDRFIPEGVEQWPMVHQPHNPRLIDDTPCPLKVPDLRVLAEEHHVGQNFQSVINELIHIDNTSLIIEDHLIVGTALHRVDVDEDISRSILSGRK